MFNFPAPLRRALLLALIGSTSIQSFVVPVGRRMKLSTTTTTTAEKDMICTRNPRMSLHMSATTVTSFRNETTHASDSDQPKQQQQQPESASPNKRQADSKRKEFSEDVWDLNQDMNRWAEAIADAPDAQHAVAAATHAEAMWQKATCRDVISFNTMLKAWSKCCQRLVELRQSVATTTNYNGNNNPGVNWADLDVRKVMEIQVYTPKDAVLHAQEWLVNPPETIQPDVQSHNIVMDAWSKSRDPMAPQKVELLFKRIQRAGAEPDTLSYNAVLDAYAYSNNPENRLEKVLHIWQRMKKEDASTPRPTIRTVNSVLHAYSREAQVQPERALEFAHAAMHILQEQLAQEEPSTGTEDPTQLSLLQPDVMTYTTVMDCWSRVRSSPTVSPVREVEALLTQMQRRAAQISSPEQRDRVSPNIYTYTTILKTWARSAPPAVEKSEALLEQLLAAWEDDGSGISTATTNDKMPAPPTNPKYNNNNKKQKPMLRPPFTVVVNRGGSRVRANAVACTAVLQAYARMRDPGQATRALKLLQRMRSMAERFPGVAPNLISYNAALDVCARTPGNAAEQTAALKIAFAIFQTIQQQQPKMSANHVTFGTLLNAVSCLMPPSEDRNKVAEAVFTKAKAAGQVDSTVLKNLKRACDAQVFQDLLQELNNGKFVDLNSPLPVHWCRNVVPTTNR